MPPTHPTSNAPAQTQQRQRDTRPSVGVPPELGKLIERDSRLVQELGWEEFVRRRRQRGDLTEMENVDHPARSLLRRYHARGVPVVTHEGRWSEEKLRQAVKRGPHPSANLHLEFLFTEFLQMINNKQWVILPYSVAKSLKNLRISPPGVVPQRDRRPRWIGDYTWSGINPDTIPIVPQESLQYGRALERFLRQILLADPKYGPIYMLKCDIADGYYRIALRMRDCPKLALAFPGLSSDETFVAIPLVLPMGWKNSGPAFCAATETIADIANATVQANSPQAPHHLDTLAEVQDQRTQMPHSPCAQRNPLLSRNTPRRAAAIDVFVDDFIALVQGCPTQRARVRRALFHSIDLVFRPRRRPRRRHKTTPHLPQKTKKGGLLVVPAQDHPWLGYRHGPRHHQPSSP